MIESMTSEEVKCTHALGDNILTLHCRLANRDYEKGGRCKESTKKKKLTIKENGNKDPHLDLYSFYFEHILPIPPFGLSVHK